MRAKRSSQCWKCQMGIAPGDKILKEKTAFVHEGCASVKPDAKGQGFLFGAKASKRMRRVFDG